MEDADTICAVSTPTGEGGIGVVRMSGQKAHAILKTIFKARNKRTSFLSRTLYLGYIVDPDEKETMDEVFAVFMEAPNTYTREDMAEVYSHGGYAVQKGILSLMVRLGARLGDPGEFTKRAYLNGRIDLPQAESVLDIIESETEEELKCAMTHLKGSLSRKLARIKGAVTGALVEAEALIDFPEEDIEVGDEYISSLKGAEKELERLVASYYEGKAVKHGFDVLIVGRTNVGKSSLLNALLSKERAIVTPLPGTTRDMIEDMIYVKGIKVKLIDSAGIGVARDVVEEEGIVRVKQRIPEADLILWVLDSSQAYTEEDEAVNAVIDGRPTLTLLNKVDLPRVCDRKILRDKGIRWLEVSARDETGLQELKQAIYLKHGQRGGKPGKVLVTSLRHRDTLAAARDALERALVAQERGQPIEIIAFELRDVLFHLGIITGETCSEDILDAIFARFCIGK